MQPTSEYFDAGRGIFLRDLILTQSFDLPGFAQLGVDLRAEQAIGRPAFYPRLLASSVCHCHDMPILRRAAYCRGLCRDRYELHRLRVFHALSQEAASG
jgi:hypothetical protein